MLKIIKKLINRYADSFFKTKVIEDNIRVTEMSKTDETDVNKTKGRNIDVFG